MQAVNKNQPLAVHYSESDTGWSVSLQWVAYAALIMLAVVLRIAELDTVPLSAAEAREALASWRVLHPGLPGETLTPSSPWLFLLHSVSFTALGASEFSARVLTGLGSVILILSPLLFRSVLGFVRTFTVSLVLTFSPVLLLASRYDSPVVWSVLGGVLLLWCVWQWWRTEQPAWALAAGALAAFTALLTDPAGLMLVLVLLASGWLALLWQSIDDPDHDPQPLLRVRLGQWPWLHSLIVAGVTVFVVSTGFGFYLPGLAGVATLLEVGFGGLLTPGAVNTPPVFALLTSLFYEPLMWGLGFLGVWLAVRYGHLTLLDRFLAMWVIMAGGAALIYQGAGAAHALWLIMPLAALASRTLVHLVQVEDHPFILIPAWAKPTSTFIIVALLCVFTINFQGGGRALLSVPGTNFMEAPFNLIHVVWMVISLVFMVMVTFLIASIWAGGLAVRSAGLGLAIFMLVTSLGTGWNAAVEQADNPIELWHVSPTARETVLLRDTLIELARRESGGFPYLPIYAEADSDGVLAWLLRDFVNVVYITDAEMARTQQVALLRYRADDPALGGSYVGKSFTLQRDWRMAGLQGLDVLPWWTQRRTRVLSLPSQTIVLWLRQDVYDGAPFTGVG